MRKTGSIFLFLCFLLCAVGYTAEGSGDLLEQAKKFFSPLPSDMATAQNPITPAKVRLGKILFYECRISVDGTVSCSKCHPFSLYATDGLRKSIGNNCRPNPRKAPTLFNAAAQLSAPWIGNRKDVEDQAKQALVGPPSFGMPSYESVEKKLIELGYSPLFKDAFPNDGKPVSADNFAKAVGAFERTLVTPAPLDDFLKGEKTALTEAEQKGLKLFIDTGCVACHSGAYIGGQAYRKFGIFEPYWKYTKSDKIDDGRYAVTKDEADKYIFKVPVLRNVAKVPPYFHDGSVDKLQDVVVIMAKIQLGKDLDRLTVDNIVTFLDSLTGKIPEDLIKVPLLP